MWPPLLGRNLITVFSTVNTPSGFFCGRAASFTGDRTRADARDASADACVTDAVTGDGRKKILVLRALRGSAASRRARARNSRGHATAAEDGLGLPCAACVFSSGKMSGSGAAQPEMRESAQEFHAGRRRLPKLDDAVVVRRHRVNRCRRSDVRGLRPRSTRHSRRARATR